MSDTPAVPTADDILPVSLLTGFLGSGKTTLINRLLKHPGMERSAVLVNEFGEIGLDHHLIEKIDEETILLNAGCLCCSVRGDLARALRDLSIRRIKGEIPPIDRVLIETTGLADPAPIIHTLMSDPVVSERYRLDGIVTTIDAVNGAQQLIDQPEPVKQAAVADRLVITKCDMAGAEATNTLAEALRAINPGAPLYRAAQGEIDPDALFGAGLYDPKTKSLDVQNWLREEAYRDDHTHAHDVNRHDTHIRAYCIALDTPLPWEVFVAWIRALIGDHGADLLRIKGIVNIAGQDRPVAIHGVQHLFHDPVPLPHWPDDDHRSRIVFITRDIEQSEVERRLGDLRRIAAGGE